MYFQNLSWAEKFGAGNKRKLGSGEIAIERKEITDFSMMNAEEVIKLLMSDLYIGLKQAEVENRLKQDGYNEVPEKKINPVVRFVRRFWGLTAWMLEIIIILSWTLRKYSDLYVVTALLFLNSIIGFKKKLPNLNSFCRKEDISVRSAFIS